MSEGLAGIEGRAGKEMRLDLLTESFIIALAC